jgi:transposase
MANDVKVFIGIDTHKDTLAMYADGGGDHWECSNDEAGIEELVTTMHKLSPTPIVVEAGGGYERRMVAAAYAAGHSVVVVNPTRVRRLAEALGIIALVITSSW